MDIEHLVALVRATFSRDPEKMTAVEFAKLANEAVFLKKLEFNLLKNAVHTAIAKVLERNE